MKVRLAVLDRELCKPRKCNYECISVCPVNKSGRAIAIDADRASRGKPVVYEDACIGCGLCVKACPFDALFIINLPSELEEGAVHRYGVNGFKLYRLPVPRKGQVVGLIGRNSMGKTTAARILSGGLRPNLGLLEGEPDWDDVVRRFRGSELQGYLDKLSSGELRVAYKVQHVEAVPRRLKGRVRDLLRRADERGVALDLASAASLEAVMERDVRELSGGELQKLVIVAALSKEADAYIFDEPSSYLDVRERVRVARLIMGEVRGGKYYLVIEHDLALLDYLSESVHVMYGEPGAYGIVSSPYGVREGINNLLDGYLPAENVRIRREPVRFRKPQAGGPRGPGGEGFLEWGGLEVSVDGFRLLVEPGSVGRGEVVSIVGPNGIGKTTFIRVLAGRLKPLKGTVKSGGALRVSYKPQYVGPEMFPEASVRDLLLRANPEALAPGSWLYEELVSGLGLKRLLDREAGSLSGGELQKLAIAVALSREADVYLIDEPSAHLDVEERLGVVRVVRRLTEAREATSFIVEHDLMVVDFVADRVMVFLGDPGLEGRAYGPEGLREGMNRLLRYLGVTFRRDPHSGRPRVNKEGSYLDRMQKSRGEFYFA